MQKLIQLRHRLVAAVAAAFVDLAPVLFHYLDR
jgi:hypothetical protein